MQFLSMSKNLLRFKLIEEKYDGEEVLIPRITLCCDDPRLPFKVYRQQFLVIDVFTTTIIKSQGQSFNQIGVYLESQVFTHIQLYLSRGMYPDKIKVPTR
jgi:hypothetical protein